MPKTNNSSKSAKMGMLRPSYLENSFVVPAPLVAELKVENLIDTNTDDLVNNNSDPSKGLRHNRPSIHHGAHHPQFYEEFNKEVRKLEMVSQNATRAQKFSAKMRFCKFVMTDWAGSTSLHGVYNIVRLDSKLLKMIWIVCFTSSLIYCFYGIYGIIANYLSYNVLTNQQVQNQAPVDFPAVTFCNLVCLI